MTFMSLYSNNNHSNIDLYHRKNSVTEPKEHCPSYYAATANQQLEFPSLKGDKIADVCIIGGGFTGVATALTLAERGFKVTVVEQHKIAWGASGRNGGQLIGGISGEEKMLKEHGDGFAEELFNLGYLGHKIIEERIKKYAIDCDYKKGYMDVAVKKRHLKTLNEMQEYQIKYGMGEHLRRIEGHEMQDVLGTDAYLGGLINNRNGHLHPLNLCLGEAKAAADLGVSFFEGSEVKNIIPGEKPAVVTEQGKVTADFVILAGNAYHQFKQKEVSGHVFPAGTYIIATEPLSEVEVASINPLDLAICDMNEILDYYRLSADKRLLFGGQCNYLNREPKSIKAIMHPRMVKVFPELAHKSIDFEWGGNVGIVPNRVPLLGRMSKNVFYSMGYNGHGVNVTHLAGEIMADAVTGTFERLEIFEKIKHHRIPFGSTFGSQMIALGRLYYRIKDLV